MPWSLFFKCWVLSQHFTSLFTFSKRLFNSSLLSAIRVVSSAYLRLLIFLPSILIPVCASSRLEFHMMYSACKLNKQGDNIQPWRTYSFPNLEPIHCSMPGSNYCFLTCIQILQEAGKVDWYPSLKKFSTVVVVHTVKGFSIVNDAEVDFFLEFSCFFQWSTACW